MAKKITSKTITKDQIEETNVYLGYTEGSHYLSDAGYAFYYNQMKNDLDLYDADRYANLNTFLGYDVGIRKFRVLNYWFWKHGFELFELTGSVEDMKLLQKATKETRTKALDFSKWHDCSQEALSYSFFEKGVCVECGYR